MTDFSKHPGHHERHLRRMDQNPLFEAMDGALVSDALNAARERDREELDSFMTGLREVMQEAIDLDSEVDSETLVTLKEKVEKHYSRCVSLQGDNSPVLRALEKVLAQMADALRAAAGDDALAQSHLDGEEAARQTFLALHRYPIVADLMRSDCVITPSELPATLLGEQVDALEAALTLFTGDQLTDLSRRARTLLERLEEKGHRLPHARRNLSLMERASLVAATPGTTS